MGVIVLKVIEDEINKLKIQLSELKEMKSANEIIQEYKKEEPTKEESIFDLGEELDEINKVIEEPEKEVDKKAKEPAVVEAKKEPEKVEIAEIVEEDLFSLEPNKAEPFATYDIRIVEDVLNNGNREAKIKMNSRWFDIERFVTPDRMNYAKWITTGRVVATNGKMMIIQYSNASLCNRMMKPDVKEIIIKLYALSS